MSYGHLHLQLLKWQYITERALSESKGQDTTSPRAACLSRNADLMAGADDMAEWAVSQKGNL